MCSVKCQKQVHLSAESLVALQRQIVDILSRITVTVRFIDCAQETRSGGYAISCSICINAYTEWSRKIAQSLMQSRLQPFAIK